MAGSISKAMLIVRIGHFAGGELWSEIGRLLANPEYTLSLPLIEGSQKGIEQLIDHDIFVVTARRPNAEKQPSNG